MDERWAADLAALQAVRLSLSVSDDSMTSSICQAYLSFTQPLISPQLWCAGGGVDNSGAVRV